MFQQDNAPAHRAKETAEQSWSHAAQDFISPDHWPSNSPDLNPADYKTWGATQQSMKKTKISDLQKTLKAKLGTTLNAGSLLSETSGATV